MNKAISWLILKICSLNESFMSIQWKLDICSNLSGNPRRWNLFPAFWNIYYSNRRLLSLFQRFVFLLIPKLIELYELTLKNCQHFYCISETVWQNPFKITYWNSSLFIIANPLKYDFMFVGNVILFGSISDFASRPVATRQMTFLSDLWSSPRRLFIVDIRRINWLRCHLLMCLTTRFTCRP